MEKYIVYKHISPSGKMYIGITDNYERRCRQHKRHAINSTGFVFHNAIRKYGWDSFRHEIIADELTREEAEKLEILMIKELNTIVPTGYNMTSGGEGVAGICGEKIRDGLRGFHLEHTKGYYFNKRAGKYVVSRMYLGKHHQFGQFVDEVDAQLKSEYVDTLSDEELLIEAEAYRANATIRKSTSLKGKQRDVGVGYSFIKSKQAYVVQRYIDGMVYNFGTYKVEQDAILQSQQLKGLTDVELLEAFELHRAASTHGKGYSFIKKVGKYRVQLTVDGKSKRFGLYTNEQDAIDKVAEIRKHCNGLH